MKIRRKGEKTRYDFVDANCLGRECFAAGMYQHRSPMSCGGSRNTGSPDSPCCLNRAYRGCPAGPMGEEVLPCDCDGKPHDNHTVQGLPLVDKRLLKERMAQGWRVA
jgi:hypothetical protein